MARGFEPGDDRLNDFLRERLRPDGKHVGDLRFEVLKDLDAEAPEGDETK